MKNGLKYVVLIVLTGIVFAVFLWPYVLRQKTSAHMVTAISSLRGISLAMHTFESEYGRFPDQSTAALVMARKKTNFDLSGSSSNDYFRQLLASEVVMSELVFRAKTPYTRKPDDKFDKPEAALAPGEVGFGYLMNGRTGMSLKSNPSGFIACAPLAYDGRVVSDRRFDAAIYDGRSVLLSVDSSVRLLPIEPQSGQVLLKSGKSILDSGPDTIWGVDVTPVIVPPLPKR